MAKELELWQFVRDRLRQNSPVMLLVVAESAGSSPGRAGYKMAVAADGELSGSIGGGVMEVRLVEIAKSQIHNSKFEINSELVEQVHRKNIPNSSGMICSGRQTVLFKLLRSGDSNSVGEAITSLKNRVSSLLFITPGDFSILITEDGSKTDFHFEKINETEFTYIEKLGAKNQLYIVGGGHCALALSEMMSRMDFHIAIFDDRPELNTIEKNRFADEIKIIRSYEAVGGLIRGGSNVYVAVMTLGYASDEIVIRQLIEHELKYFGVLGSRAKMKTLLTTLEKDGLAKDRLDRIHTPVGLPIDSHTPEEIAVSIAAEIIAIKNAE